MNISEAWDMIARAFEVCDDEGDGNLYGTFFSGICGGIIALRAAMAISEETASAMRANVFEFMCKEGIDDGFIWETSPAGAAERARYCRARALECFPHAELNFEESANGN